MNRNQSRFLGANTIAQAEPAGGAGRGWQCCSNGITGNGCFALTRAKTPGIMLGGIFGS
ncbi:MAG TPA: hypothetical protein VK673_21955 [Chthoniobacterales bacterium]|nr:hypothetical protein [Chthoniobacterales bacterium]